MKIGFLLLALSLAGCSHPVQRFVPAPISTNPDRALDTKTGKLCMTSPKRANETEELPFCEDLYLQ
jgi:hypothetical protein